MRPVEAIIFDKDGTLFDFQATWAPVFAEFLETFREEERGAVAEALGFDVAQRRFRQGSVVIAGTTEDSAKVLSAATELAHDEAVRRLDAAGKGARQHPAVDLPACLSALAARFRLGLVTNDTEAPARGHLRQEGIHDLFAFVAGYDSGFGSKPAPGQLLGFCQATGSHPDTTLMVGDSRHDLVAGRAAGMRTVGVLTGVAEADELRDLADVILPDIGHLAAWIDATA